MAARVDWLAPVLEMEPTGGRKVFAGTPGLARVNLFHAGAVFLNGLPSVH